MEPTHTNDKKPLNGKEATGTASPKQERSSTKQSNQEEKDKAWYEQIAGAIPQNPEEQKKWYQLLTHPMSLIAGVLLLGYGWISRKEKKYQQIEQENETLRAELKALKKKYKKLKKQERHNEGQSGPAIPVTVLE